jgi:hypothetical protein
MGVRADGDRPPARQDRGEEALMITYEFWRAPDDHAILAVRLTDGCVTGWCGPLHPGDVMVDYLPDFAYTGSGCDDLEARREGFELLDEDSLLYLSTAAD